MSECVYPRCKCVVKLHNGVWFCPKENEERNNMSNPDNDRPVAVMMTAAVARELTRKAKQLDSEYAKAETEGVLKQVEKAANQAQNSCNPHIPYKYKDVIEQHLKELGFTVKYHDGDQRDPGFHTVSW